MGATLELQQQCDSEKLHNLLLWFMYNQYKKQQYLTCWGEKMFEAERKETENVPLMLLDKICAGMMVLTLLEQKVEIIE